MNLDSITTLLGDNWKGYSSLIREQLHSDVSLLNDINESQLAHPGKQVRPILALLFAQACGTPGSDSYRVAAAVEMLHNATLMHDDVADASDTRRGLPTLHSLVGPTSAILIGDFWLSRAISTLSGNLSFIGLFASTASNLAEGEMLQLQCAATASTSEEDYLRIIYCKTASLFETACRAGAFSVGASEATCDAAAAFGRAFGMAFQIRDDILDYTGDEGFGKPVGIDLREQKITLPLLGVLSKCDDAEEVREMVRQIPAHPEYCDKLYQRVRDEGGVEYALGYLDEYTRAAMDALEALPDGPEREMLTEIVRFGIARRV